MNIIKVLNKALKLTNVEKLTVTEYLICIYEVNRVVRWLKETEMRSFRDIVIACYGLRDTTAYETYNVLKSAATNLENDILSLDNIASASAHGTSTKLHNNYFNLDKLNSYLLFLKPHVKQYELYKDNSIELHKQALRFDETSDYEQVVEDVNGHSIKFLYKENGEYIEKEYTFRGWEQWSSKRRVESTDGDKWPIIKLIFAELYV